MFHNEASETSVSRRSASRAEHSAKCELSSEIGGCAGTRGPNLAETIRSLIMDCGNPARVLELYYWSQQPGFADAVRALAMLPPEMRAIIQSFLTMARRDRIDVVMLKSGKLCMSSPDVALALNALRAARATAKSG